MYRLGHQVIFAAIGIAGAGIAVVLEGRGDDPRATWGWWTARVAGVCSCGAGGRRATCCGALSRAPRIRKTTDLQTREAAAGPMHAWVARPAAGWLLACGCDVVFRIDELPRAADRARS